MTVESVRAFFAAHAPEITIIELAGSTATVELAAKGHGVQPAQIAKTLSLRLHGEEGANGLQAHRAIVTALRPRPGQPARASCGPAVRRRSTQPTHYVAQTGAGGARPGTPAPIDSGQGRWRPAIRLRMRP